MSAQRYPPAILSRLEQGDLLAQPNPRTPTGLRNLCIITLILRLGLRSGEILALGEEDVSLENGHLNVPALAGRPGRILGLDREDLALLERWRRQKPPSSGKTLFCTLAGRPLSDRYLRDMIKRLARKAGIEKDVYPGLLRYTFAVEFMTEHEDLCLLQQALGHNDAATTRQYASFYYDRLVQDRLGSGGKRRSGMPFTAPSLPQASPSPLEDKTVNKDYLPQPPCSEKGSLKLGVSLKKNNLSHDTGEYKETGADKPGTKPDDINLKGINGNISHRSYNIEPNSASPQLVQEAGRGAAIPALKCSSCSYILRRQEDCPRCGARFSDILRHWGKNF